MEENNKLDSEYALFLINLRIVNLKMCKADAFK